MLIDLGHEPIPTWTEAATLAYCHSIAANSEFVVESGSYMGASAKAMLWATGIHLWCVDKFEVFGTKQITELFLREWIQKGRCEIIQGDMDKAGEMYNRAKEEAAQYGISLTELAARRAEVIDPRGVWFAEQLRMQEAAKSLRDLTQAVGNYNLAMNGATKDQLAFAAAADPVAGKLAQQKTLLEEGLRVTKENQSPAEKYNQNHRELSALLKATTISQLTYNRAMMKANEELNKVTQPLQATLAGSAQSLANRDAYRELLNANKNLPAPVADLGSAVLAGSAESASRKDQTTYLKLILDELCKLNKTPPVNIKPADLR